MTRTWFITGASSGFGREWTLAALERGDAVAATARDVGTLADLVGQFGSTFLPLQLDVTDRAAVFAAVAGAHRRFGRLDVVVNNAGYGLFGMVEEVSDAEARAQFDANFFGALSVTQAALPYLRAQGSGHLLQVSSNGGIISGPEAGVYCASKWALEGLSQALAAEVAGFGIKVTLVEPGYFGTRFGSTSRKEAAHHDAYAAFREQVEAARQATYPSPGNPAATREAVLRIVDAEEPPLRIFLGDGPLALAEADYASRLETWRAWEAVSVAAHG